MIPRVEEDTIRFGGRTISFRVRFTGRKTLGISVNPGMDVEITAPIGADAGRIRELVRRKARWIIRQQRYFLAFHPRPSPRVYRSGETHFYLGRQALLKVKTGPATEVSYKGRTFEVTLAGTSKAKNLLENWFRQRAREKFPVILSEAAERFSRYSVRPSGLVIKRMPGRWGSCSAGGMITLHPDLIKAPRGCIEYVINHELCHLVHRNHDNRFWDLQSKMMPDWRKWKNRLESLFG